MSTYVSNRNGGATDEQGHYRFHVKAWSGNVLEGLAVSQNSPLAMSVLVGVGDLKIDYLEYAYTAWNDANAVVTIATSDTSNGRIDRIIAYIDRGMTPDPDFSNNPEMLKFIAVAGTPSATPVKASDGTVNTAVGASNPWCELATVSVAEDVTTISDVNITDTREFVSPFITSEERAGWQSLPDTPDTVTYNGNRSYNLVFNGEDHTDIFSEGMRIRTERIVTPPTQSTSLNGTTQYWSKSSPNKLTFTDDFVVSVHVKLESYNAAGSTIASRWNGSSGWILFIDASGLVILSGYNAAAGNFSRVLSYQSVPLGKWVHIAAQLDMSAFTATTTTSYIMIDGVDVPATVSRAGTNPTALVQAGNLEIGGANAGTLPFDGKIAQAGVFNAKVTQATMRGYISQGLSGSETSLASAFSFNGVATDLNTTTPNDLTAQASAGYTTQSPFSGGGSLSASKLDYGIVTKTAFSTNTTLTVQVPEGYAIPTSGGVSATSYSSQDTPYRFPSDKGRWVVTTLILSTIAAPGGAGSTVYNPGGINLNVPIGAWDIVIDCIIEQIPTSTIMSSYAGLSTSASTFSDPELEDLRVQGGLAAGSDDTYRLRLNKPIVLTAATPYYALIYATIAVNAVTKIRGTVGTNVNEVSKIYAVCAYL